MIVLKTEHVCFLIELKNMLFYFNRNNEREVVLNSL